MSAISTAIVTSIIVWCVMRRPPSPAGTGAADDDKGVTELATVIYHTPHIIKEHNYQSASVLLLQWAGLVCAFQ